MPASNGNDEEEKGKLFVGALAWNTTDQSLKDYFSKYGEVKDTVVMIDRVTLRSRGFGFVTFRDPECVTAVLKDRSHKLDDKDIDPKPCTPKALQLQKRNAAIEHVQKHKVFVGGLARDATEEDVKEYFERFGVVTEVVFVIDKDDQKHKGFGFVTFEEAKSVDEVLSIHFHIIKGRKAEAKRAQPRDKMLTGTVRPPHKQQQYQPQPPYVPDSYGYGGPQIPRGPSGGWMPNVNTSDYGRAYSSGAPGPGYYGYDYPMPPAYPRHPVMPDYDYHQSESSYGPAKGAYYGGDPGYYGNGGTSDSYSRKPSGAQGYHPYRR